MTKWENKSYGVEIDCPRCGQSFRNVAVHMRTCDGGGGVDGKQ